MDDSQIVALYWQRDEQAIVETDAKYGSYCMKISQNILSDRADSEENVNDAYLHAWEAMPSLTTDYLGSENAGLVCSLVMIGFGVASVGTSFLAKAVNTSMAFIPAGVIAIVGILVTLALPKLGKAEQQFRASGPYLGPEAFLRKNMIFSHRGYLTTTPCIVLLYKFRTS